MRGRTKKENGTNRLTSIYILEIIKSAGIEGIIKSDIKKKISKKYEQEIDLKTLGFYLSDLLLENKIKKKRANSRLYVTQELYLNSEDIELLEDLVTYSKGIDRKHALKILEKLSAIRIVKSSNNKKYIAKKILRTTNENVSNNLIIIRRAIVENKQIKIKNIAGKIYHVTPYEIIVQDSIYYLICHYPERKFKDNEERIETRRIDRIKTVEILDANAVEYKKIASPNLKTAELDIVDYITSRVYPMSGDEISIILSIQKELEYMMKENFLEDNITILSNNNNETKVRLLTNRKSFISWYIRYYWIGKIEEPLDVIEEIIENTKNILRKYTIND